MYPKNAATPPRISIGPVVQISDGAVQTSGVSISVTPEGGTASAGGGTTSYVQGVVHYAPTQAETNYTAFTVVAYKTGCIPADKTVVTTASSTAGQVDVGMFGGSAGTFSSGRPEVNTTHWGGTAVASATVNANATQISGDSAAADNLEAALDGTGGVTISAALTGNITGNLSGSVGSVTGAVGSVTGAVGSVTGNVGGSVAGSVGSLAAQAKADVNAEVDTALGDYDGPTHDELVALIQILARSDAAIETDRSAALALINADEGSGAGDYSAQTDSLEASQAEHDVTQSAVTAVDDYVDSEVAQIISLLGTPVDSDLATDIANMQADVTQIAGDLPSRPTKGVALANFSFLMVDGTDFATPETGLTVAGNISKDGGSFASLTNSVTEIANGMYKVTLTATEMNADIVILRFTATGAADRFVTILTQP